MVNESIEDETRGFFFLSFCFSSFFSFSVRNISLANFEMNKQLKGQTEKFSNLIYCLQATLEMVHIRVLLMEIWQKKKKRKNRIRKSYFDFWFTCRIFCCCFKWNMMKKCVLYPSVTIGNITVHNLYKLSGEAITLHSISGLGFKFRFHFQIRVKMEYTKIQEGSLELGKIVFQ